MKKQIWISIAAGVLLVVLLIATEGYKTAADFFMESYAAVMRKQTGGAAAEIRAEEYRKRYENCSAGQDCVVISGEKDKQEFPKPE